ncbi:MAG: hypothetical protein AAF805_06615 [Planctomycetota bacterium]
MREEISQRIAAAPFEPFVIALSDGKELTVSHPDQAMLTEQRLYVAEGDTVHRCALLHVTRVAVAETAG